MEVAHLGVKVTSDGVETAEDRLKKFQAAGLGAEMVVGSLARAAGAMSIALAGAFSVGALGGYADAWTDMQSRVGSAIKNMAAAPALMQRITDIANASYSPLQQTNEILGRNVTVLGALGRSATEAADFTEALNHALVTTATKGQDADVVLNSLSRAISNGKLRAIEFETIMSRSPRVLEAIAEGMGTNVIGLRSLAEQGKVTGKVIVDSMINSLEKLRDEAGAMPATMKDASMIWNNVFNEVVGRVDQAWQATGRLAAKSIELAIAFRGTADVLIRVGNIIGTALGPAFDLITSNLGTVATVAQIAVAAIAGFYAPAILGGLWTLQAAIGTGIVGAVRAVTLAMMANPLGLLIAGLAAAVTAAFLFRDQIKQAIGLDVVAVMVDVGDKTIGVFVGAYEAVKEQWSNLPTFFSAIGKMAWNNFLESFEGPALTIETPWGKWESGGFDLSGAKATLSPNEMRSFNTAEAAFNEAYMRGGYIKGVNDSVAELWENAEGANSAIADLGNSLGGAGSTPLSKEALKQAEKYKDLVRGAHEFIASQTLEQQALGLSAEAAARMRYEQEMLNKAANDNIKLGPAQRAEISGLAAAMAAAEEATRRLTEIYNFGKDVFKGFFGDIRSGIMEGKGLWESLGNAAVNALDKIAQKSMDMALNGIWDMVFGGLMGGLGGGMGGGMWNIPSAFKPGGFFPGFATGTNYAPGGMAWVGERGPELVNLPRGSQVIPHQQSMAMAANGNGSNDNRPIVQIIDQRRRGGSIVQEETTGTNGEAQLRLIIRDEVQQAQRRGAVGF